LFSFSQGRHWKQRGVLVVERSLRVVRSPVRSAQRLKN